MNSLVNTTTASLNTPEKLAKVQVIAPLKRNDNCITDLFNVLPTLFCAEPIPITLANFYESFYQSFHSRTFTERIFDLFLICGPTP